VQRPEDGSDVTGYGSWMEYQIPDVCMRVYRQVTWYVPHSDYGREPSLEFIYRKQRFYTFLALRDLNNNVYQILKTVAWTMELAIQVMDRPRR